MKEPGPAGSFFRRRVAPAPDAPAVRLPPRRQRDGPPARPGTGGVSRRPTPLARACGNRTRLARARTRQPAQGHPPAPAATSWDESSKRVPCPIPRCLQPKMSRSSPPTGAAGDWRPAAPAGRRIESATRVEGARREGWWTVAGTRRSVRVTDASSTLWPSPADNPQPVKDEPVRPRQTGDPGPSPLMGPHPVLREDVPRRCRPGSSLVAVPRGAFSSSACRHIRGRHGHIHKGGDAGDGEGGPGRG